MCTDQSIHFRNPYQRCIN